MVSVTAIGLMRGTSYDWMDLAFIDTDGGTIGRFGTTGCRTSARTHARSSAVQSPPMGIVSAPRPG